MELNEPIGKHTGNKTTHAKRDKIAFCAKTALEFAHLLHDEQADPPRALITSLPVHAPSDIELMEALRSLGIPNLLERISPPAHLLFETGSHHRKTPFRVPRRCAVLPKGRTFLRLGENMFAASPNLALCEIADEHGSLFDLLLLLWEACGSYRTHLTWTGTMYETDPLTSVRSLERFVTDNPRKRGPSAGARTFDAIFAGRKRKSTSSTKAMNPMKESECGSKTPVGRTRSSRWDGT